LIESRKIDKQELPPNSPDYLVLENKKLGKIIMGSQLKKIVVFFSYGLN
jgi:hypothetical protein